MKYIDNIKEMRNIWNGFSKEWKTVLKSNIFNWFTEEENKIFNKNYEIKEHEDFDNEPWFNYTYEPSDNELCRIFRIKYLSTVICDASPWGGSEYTPDLDLSVMEYFTDVTYLDVSCTISDNWNMFISKIPIMKTVTDLRIVLDNIYDLNFVKDKFPNIERLDCSCNKITTLKPLYDLKIKELSIIDNPISSDNVWDYIRNAPFCKIGVVETEIRNTFELNK